MKKVTYCETIDGELDVRFTPITEKEKKNYKQMKPKDWQGMEVSHDEYEYLAEEPLEKVRERVAEILWINHLNGLS